MTELSPVTHAMRPGDKAAPAGTIGKPLVDVDCKIINENVSFVNVLVAKV